jgi:hypothetical protein
MLNIRAKIAIAQSSEERLPDESVAVASDGPPLPPRPSPPRPPSPQRPPEPAAATSSGRNIFVSW